MSSTGNVFAGTGENNAGIGATAWTTPGNITATDANDATCNPAASSQYLVARNYGFSVPAGASINGITVRINASEHTAGTQVVNAQLQNDSAALVGSSKTATLNGTTKTVYTYGTTADVWGATLTSSIVNNANFGARFWFTAAHDVRIDYVTLAVEYTVGAVPLGGSATTGSAGTAAPGTTHTVTGTASTVSSGTIVPASTPPLVGTAIPVQQGTIPTPHGLVIQVQAGAVGTAQPLVGTASTVGSGTITINSNDITEFAFGAESATGQGTAPAVTFIGLRSRKVGGGSATNSINGGLTTSASGLFTPFPSAPPVGQVAALFQGVLAKSRVTALTGSAVAPAGGFVSASGSGGGALIWQFTDGATLNPKASQSITLATNLPAGAITYASPDPLPGQSLAVSANVLSLVSDATLPTTDYTRPVVIEVMDQPLAFCNHYRSGTLIGQYGSGFSTPIWSGIQDLARDGDIFEISPGAVTSDLTLGVGVPSAYLEKAILKVNQSITIRGMSGRGRWTLLPATMTPADTATYSGITCLSPGDIAGTGWDYNPTTAGRRKSYTIQNFQCDNWGNVGDDHAIHLRVDAEDGSTFNNLPLSFNLSNFKLGKRTGYGGGSVITGSAETLTLADGHVYDGGDGSGQEHNLYLEAPTMSLTGVRVSRTRGWTGAPYTSTVTLEGHLLKAAALTGTIEGCVFDCVDSADESLLVQMRAGGNWTIRGNLFREGAGPNVGLGAITMLREYNASETVPNYPWWAGSTGNSLLMEKNAFVFQYPRPIFFTFDPAVHPLQTMYASGDTSVAANRRMSSCTIRDNVGMVNPGPSPQMLAGFPGTGNSLWINRDPNSSATWSARGNTTIIFDSTEAPFSNRPLKEYKLIAGPIIAGAGTVSTYRFAWPHASTARSDALQGLG